MVVRNLYSAIVLLFLGACATPTTEDLLSDARLSSLSLMNPQAVDGRVLTGGQPSKEDLAYLKDQGFGTVINLRRAEEDLGYNEKAEAEQLGLAYVNIPVNASGDINASTAAYLRSVLNQTDAPVLLHCGSGNRVGALYAMGALHIDGKSIDEALAIGRSAGLTSFEPAVRTMMEDSASN